MAFTTVPTYTTNQLITASHGNTYWRDNINQLWPFTTAGDLAYASAAATLARIGIGAAGKRLGSDGSVPSWLNGAPLLDYGTDDDATFTSTATASWQDTGAEVTLTLPVTGIVIAIATGNVRSIGGNGYHAYLSAYIDGENGNTASQYNPNAYYMSAHSIHIKSCAAGSITCKCQAYAYGSNTAGVKNSRIAAFAFPAA